MKTTSQSIPLTEAFFQGVLSVERVGDTLRPWRLPHHRRHLYPSPNDRLMQKAGFTSGVRLRFATDAETLTLGFDPLPEPGGNLPNGHTFDAVIDNRIVQTVSGYGDATEVRFDTFGSGFRTLEIWLPPGCAVALRGLQVPVGARVMPVPDRRPMWITWGSSLTHCVRAGSAARVWPATVARRHNLNLVNLGFGGDCHLEPMVAMTIRDLPASFISMKLGINTISGSVNVRTYAALVTGAVAIVREKHPHTPLALISPMAAPRCESTPNVCGYTLQGMRRDMAEVCRALVAQGDRNLYYVDGLEFFGLDDIARYATDDVHPNAEGIDLQAERFSRLAMPLLLGNVSN